MNQIPPTPTRLDYATERRGGRSWWGIASVIRAAIVFFVVCYLVINVYLWMPRNEIFLTEVWPPTFVISIFGIIYARRGLRIDIDRRWATCGFWLNLTLGLIAFLGTLGALDSIDRAYRFNHGVIIQADR